MFGTFHWCRNWTQTQSLESIADGTKLYCETRSLLPPLYIQQTPSNPIKADPHLLGWSQIHENAIRILDHCGCLHSRTTTTVPVVRDFLLFFFSYAFLKTQQSLERAYNVPHPVFGSVLVCQKMHEFDAVIFTRRSIVSSVQELYNSRNRWTLVNVFKYERIIE